MRPMLSLTDYHLDLQDAADDSCLAFRRRHGRRPRVNHVADMAEVARLAATQMERCGWGSPSGYSRQTWRDIEMAIVHSPLAERPLGDFSAVKGWIGLLDNSRHRSCR